MRTVPLTLALAVGCALASSGARADIDIDATGCRKQLEALLRLDLNCEIELKPGLDALAGIPAALAALAPGMVCKVEVKFRKVQIYSEWISDTQAKLPDFPITCTVTAGGRSDQFTALFRVECIRANGAWGCSPILHDTRGLGILGRPLESYVNTNDLFRNALTKIVMGS
jgi:hypothetical protein